MRAIEITEFGDPEVLQLVEVERPEPAPTEILVRVHAAGVNPVDWKTRASGAFLAGLTDSPYRLGWDVSGVVEAVGAGVTRFEPGDPVFGMPWFPREAGAYAEYVTAPSRQFARKPERLSHTEAAGLPLAGLTAWQALVDAAGLEADHRLLILGAGGGVGHLAVQIAKDRGAHVTGTASASKHDFLTDLGADRVVDYNSASPTETDAPYDVILDLIGGETGLEALPALSPGGTYIPVPSASATESADRARERGFRVFTLLVEPDGHGLEELARLADRGSLRVEIDSTFPLSRAAAAHRHGEQGHTRGKIVLQVAEDTA